MNDIDYKKNVVNIMDYWLPRHTECDYHSLLVKSLCDHLKSIHDYIEVTEDCIIELMNRVKTLENRLNKE